MYVIKRNKHIEEFNIEKIIERLKGIEPNFNYTKIIYQIYLNLYKENNVYIQTKDIDLELCYLLSGTNEPEFIGLAAKLFISNFTKSCLSSFKLFYEKYHYLFNDSKKIFIQNHLNELESIINYERDYMFDLTGITVLYTSYLLRNPKTNEVIERPQWLYLRVAIQLGRDNLDLIKQLYDYQSTFKISFSTPILYNSCIINNQLCSCFIDKIEKTSITSIFDHIKKVALLINNSGGVCIDLTAISYTKTNYTYSVCSLLPMFNSITLNVKQNKLRRPGSICVNLELWHEEIEKFISLKAQKDIREGNAIDIFYSISIPDLFMKRLKEGGIWSLFDPIDADILRDVYDSPGKENFTNEYIKLENNNKAVKTIKCLDLMNLIIASKLETGGPIILFSDTINLLSPESDVTKTSNLCGEITQSSKENEIAVCCLGSVDLKYLDYENSDFDTGINLLVKGLNEVFKVGLFPIFNDKMTFKKNRSIGIGVKGLADYFMERLIPYDSDKARMINKDIFKKLLKQSVIASINDKTNNIEITIEDNLNLFDTPEEKEKYYIKNTNRFICGNLYLTALMPTASTSQITNSTESFEPITSNIYLKRLTSGNFTYINLYLYKELKKLNLWNENIKNAIYQNNGEITKIKEIPKYLKEVFKTVYEIDQNLIIQMAADRSPYINQSQSLNLYLYGNEKDLYARLAKLIFNTWKLKLKTGNYYLRVQPAFNTLKYGLKDNSNCSVCE